MLGLDNAATPMGLKAMKEMQTVNPHKESASNPQIMFLVLNTSGLTIIPISIMVYRTQFGAANPADIFLPVLLATFFSTLAGVLTVSLVQRSEEHTSELQSRPHLVCRLLLEKKKQQPLSICYA